jgi:GNAT superfamily N-acetyltransferase
MDIRELSSDAELSSAFSLMAILRDRVKLEATFLSELHRQRQEGYRLFGAYKGSVLVGLAGIRRSHTLARGDHLFVDDLVTLPEERGTGVGKGLLAHVEALARSQGVPRVYLDSRDTAKSFYAQLGFTFLTSVPCWRDAKAD